MISDKEYFIIHPNKKLKKQKIRRRIIYTFYFLTLFIFFYFALNLAAFYKKLTFIPKSSSITPINAEPKVERIKEKPKPVSRVYISDLPNNYIAIPTLGITAPISWSVSLDNIYTKLEEGIVHMQNTALPNEDGNVFIFGHSSNYAWAPGSYNQVFAVLPKININDNIVINYQNQQFLYKVNATKIVNPKDISVMQPTAQPTLTLMTCVPVGTALNRFIVQAQLVEGLVYDDPEHKNLKIEYLPKVL